MKEDKSLLEQELRAELKLLLISNDEKQLQYSERTYMLEKILMRYDCFNPLANFDSSSDEEQQFKGIVKEEAKDETIDKLKMIGRIGPVETKLDLKRSSG